MIGAPSPAGRKRIWLRCHTRRETQWTKMNGCKTIASPTGFYNGDSAASFLSRANALIWLSKIHRDIFQASGDCYGTEPLHPALTTFMIECSNHLNSHRIQGTTWRRSTIAGDRKILRWASHTIGKWDSYLFFLLALWIEWCQLVKANGCIYRVSRNCKRWLLITTIIVLLGPIEAKGPTEGEAQTKRRDEFEGKRLSWNWI